MKESLEKLVDDAKQVMYRCENCNRNYSIEDAIPHFTCNFCQGFRLVQKEANVTEAQDLRDRGLQMIRHLEKLMRECLDVILPTSFFGNVHEGRDEPRPTQRTRNYVTDGLANRGYAVIINLPEAEEERFDGAEDLKDADKDLLKYYHRYERRLKRKKIPETSEIIKVYTINGTSLPISNISPQMQVDMNDGEHNGFSKYMLESLKFL